MRKSTYGFVCLLAVFALTLPTKALAYNFFVGPNQIVIKWDLSSSPSKTIYWNVDPAAPPILRESIKECLSQWSNATNGALRFTEGTGGIQIKWDVNGTQTIDRMFLAVTSFVTDRNANISGATVVINAHDYDWHRGSPFGVGPAGEGGMRNAELDGVVLHELGHALGLNHSDSKPETLRGATTYNDLPTMNSFMFPGAESLHVDDDSGINILYGGKSKEELPPVPELVIEASPRIGKAPLTTYFSGIDLDSNTQWDFGDGISVSGAEVAHRFYTPGTYTVRASCNGKAGTIVVEVTKTKPKLPKVPKASKVKKPKKPKRNTRSKAPATELGSGPSSLF